MTNGLGRFEGYGVLITGAARGIGEATARRLASEGARVLITDVDGEQAALTAADIPGADSFRCDVADRTSVHAAVAYAVERFGALDVLVNSASSCTPDTPLVEDLPDDAWLRDLDITLTGAFRCARAAMPHLEASGRGAIVRTLAGDGAPRGVRVNQINPGTVRTPTWSGREKSLEALSDVYPLGRVGEPADIAAAVAFLASSDAAWITGTTLRVDGGLLAVNGAFEAVMAEERRRDARRHGVDAIARL